jgi:hypothetical protein
MAKLGNKLVGLIDTYLNGLGIIPFKGNYE